MERQIAGWEQIAETAQAYVAELMALRLREAGIEARVLDQSFRQEPLPNVRSFAVVRLLVPAELAAAARDVLERAQPLPWEAEPAEEEPGSR